MNKQPEKRFLSPTEAAVYAGISVREIHQLVKENKLTANREPSGQIKIELNDVEKFKQNKKPRILRETHYIQKFNARQTIINSDSRDLFHTKDDSVHLAVTSPPYFNAKLYSTDENDVGNIHDLDTWLEATGKVWSEVYRVLAPGRKFFLNLMNLPVKENKSFRTINLCGKTIDLCEQIGFIFKTDIIWHKTNGVRSHFGSYPYPGGILINYMHEHILEFEKPGTSSQGKYAHVTDEQKERSKLDKDFWLSLKNSDVWLIKPEKSGDGREHSAPFPVEIPHRLIRAYTYIGETVLDPFLGSGTTLLAASQLERNGVGYEINDKYCQLAKNRIEDNWITSV